MTPATGPKDFPAEEILERTKSVSEERLPVRRPGEGGSGVGSAGGPT